MLVSLFDWLDHKVVPGIELFAAAVSVVELDCCVAIVCITDGWVLVGLGLREGVSPGSQASSESFMWDDKQSCRI